MVQLAESEIAARVEAAAAELYRRLSELDEAAGRAGAAAQDADADRAEWVRLASEVVRRHLRL